MTTVASPGPRFLVLITALFTGALIISNIVAIKVSDFGGHYLVSAIIVFPLSYIFGDILTEVYGFKVSRRVIWSAFLANAMCVVAIVAAGKLPAAPFWTQQGAYDAILGQTWRFVAASFVAFLAGEFTNAIVLARMKIATDGKWLWSRTIGSTILGEGVDTVLFVLIAFLGRGVPNLHILIWESWLFKVGFEIATTPLTYFVVNALKRIEGLDTYDRGVVFNPVAVWE